MPRPRKERTSMPVDAPPVGRRQLWEDVAASIRESILSGALPAGANLVEADLAEHFDVSRGPIRDALRALAQEGLVADLPYRGSVVSTLTFADLREVYAIREGLEIISARRVIERTSSEVIAGLSNRVLRMEEAWDRGATYDESLGEDLAFHRDLVALGRNGRLAAVYEQMLSQTQLLVRTAAVANPSLGAAMRRSAHRDIHEAIIERDPDRARRAIEDHYAYAVERLYDGLAAGPPSAGPEPSSIAPRQD